jgi:ribosomal protein S18 acetylase RimI-like enzyme
MANNNIKILCSPERLTESQEKQFRTIVYQAFKAKFDKQMGHVPDKVEKAMNLIVESNLFPLNDRICAIDTETDEVLGLILLSRFEVTPTSVLIKFLFKLLFLVGLSNTVKLTKAFSDLDSLNTKSQKTCFADVYLAATKETHRGRGIGTQVMDYAFRHYINKAFNLAEGDHKISLIVYDGNPAIHLYKRFGFEVIETFETKSLANIMGSEYHTHLLMEKIIKVQPGVNSDTKNQSQEEQREFLTIK